MVEEIFGDSIHREVVGRSAKLLKFLSGMEDSLTTEHLDLIWRSCVGKAEPELQVRGEAFAVVLLSTLYRKVWLTHKGTPGDAVVFYSRYFPS